MRKTRVLFQNSSHSVSQIHTGIDQVAQVIAQNSATAEKSAAASEKMSSQAAVQEELPGLFRVKDSNTDRIPDTARRLPEKQYINTDTAGNTGKY